MRPSDNRELDIGAPQELSKCGARRVVPLGNAWYGAFLAIVGICAGIYGIGSYLYQLNVEIPHREILRARGINVLGTVTHISVTRHGGEYVEYSFRASDKTYSGDAQVAPRNTSDIEQGRVIWIRYDPSDPRVNHPAAWEWSASSGLNVVVFVAIFALIGFVVTIYLLREVEIARHGEVARGEVIGCERARGAYRVTYRFVTNTGMQLDGTSDCKEEYREGERIWVLYLTQQPKRNRSYPMLNFGIDG